MGCLKIQRKNFLNYNIIILYYLSVCVHVYMQCTNGVLDSSTHLGMIRSRLKGRSSKTLVGLGRMFHRLNSSGGGGVDGAITISRLQLQQALRAFHISLTPEVSAYHYYMLRD